MKPNRNRVKLFSIPLLIMLVILVPIISSSCMGMSQFPGANQFQEQDLGIETYQVIRGNILQESTTTGSIDAKDTNTYIFNVTGEVISAFGEGLSKI